MNAIPTENLHLVNAALLDFPRPDTLAETVLRDWLRKQGIETAPQDIDVVTVHYQLEVLGEGRKHFRENAILTQRMNLVQALLSNWQGETAEGYGGFHYGDWAGLAPHGPLTLVERLEPASFFSNAPSYLIFNGLYVRQTPELYGPANKLAVRAEDFQGFIWGLHFHTLYKTQLDAYWQHNLTLYQRALKINFIAACNRQVAEGSLGEAARDLIWQAADLKPRRHVLISLLNVYGYTTTSVVCLRSQNSALTVLYIPGNSSPFQTFDTPSAMKYWLAGQCQASDRRAALLELFSSADWPDGLDFSGVRTALTGLGLYPRFHRFSVNSHPGFATSGLWVPEDMIDYRADRYSPPISTELFGYLARRHQQRAYADLDQQIVSNHQIDKSRWTSYLNVAMVMLIPVAMAVPALGALLAIGGLTQFALGLDRVINGRSLQDKAEGVQAQAFGLFNALPLVGHVALRASAIYRYCRPGFVGFRELVQTSESAEELALQPAEAAFRESPVQSSPQLGAVVCRVDQSLRHRFFATLATDEGLEQDWVCYELKSDSFIRVSQVRQASPTRWALAADNPDALTPLTDTSRQIDDGQRMSTLRALGIDVELPLDYSRFQTLVRTPLERLITSVWVGNRVMDDAFIDAIAHNATLLRGSGYRYQLLLSRQDMASFEANLDLLTVKAAGVQLLTLEEQPVFLEFERSPYFAQYQAALKGDGKGATHFSSASDILRYRLLRHYGGLYMDADDTLLPMTGTPPVLPLERKTLSCTADGLVLAAPVSNDQLGMYIKFNSSLIGSHPNNPTLDAISDEILRRYQREPAFYARRPDAEQDPVGLDRYARQLNQMTGPGMLNDVIDQHLPWLSQLRETCNLLASPIHDVYDAVDSRAFMDTLADYAPLGDMADIGCAHSWQNH